MADSVLAIGLGNMGYPLAGRLAATRSCWVHDLNGDAVRRHNSEHGSRPALSLADAQHVAREVRYVLTCLPNTDLTERMVDALGPSLRPGCVWVDATSGRAADARRLAGALARRHQVRYADCAVSGGPINARKGSLTVMLGGDAESAAEARALVSCFAAPGRAFLCGPVGSGHAVKAVNNSLLATSLIAAGEGVGALAKMGIDPAVAAEVISASSGRSWATMQRFPDNVLPRNPYGFALGLLRKDCDNALGLVEGGRSAQLLTRVRDLMRAAEQELGPAVCHCEVANRHAAAAGVDVSRQPPPARL